MPRIARFHSVAVYIAVVVLTLAGMASASSPVLLTVNGPTRGMVQEYDLDRLRALPTVTIHTSTIWTEGMQSFTGVPLNALLQTLGISHGTIHAVALNDYAVDIPVTDAVPDGPIIAFANNGIPMTVRDKGPLWIIYPFDSNAAYRSDVIYSRSIWQLIRLDVGP